MANVAIPVSAKIERYFRGTYQGDTIEVTLYQGTVSDGYKSDFTARPARWISWERYTECGFCPRRASRYGGKRFDRGPVEYDESVAQLLAAGVIETERG